MRADQPTHPPCPPAMLPAHQPTQVLNIAAMRVLVPRIDVTDPSGGTSAPAFALSDTLYGAGSEYLMIGLGGGILGVYSLATGG